MSITNNLSNYIQGQSFPSLEGNQYTPLEALNKKIELAQMDADHYMQLNQHDRALEMKLEKSALERNKIELEFKLSHKDTSPSDNDRESLQQKLLEHELQHAEVRINHYQELKNFEKMLEALDQLKEILSAKISKELSADKKFSVIEALVKLENRRVEAFKQLNNREGMFEATIEEFEQQFEIYLTLNENIDLYNQLEGNKWAYVLYESMNFRNTSLKTAAEINLTTYQPDLSSAMGNKGDEQNLIIQKAKDAYQHYVQKNSIAAHLFVELVKNCIINHVEVSNNYALAKIYHWNKDQWMIHKWRSFDIQHHLEDFATLLENHIKYLDQHLQKLNPSNSLYASVKEKKDSTELDLKEAKRMISEQEKTSNAYVKWTYNL